MNTEQKTSDFDRNYFAEEITAERSKVNHWGGQIGLWILHAIKITLLVYTGFHGINAAMHYASAPLAKVAQVVGFISVELVLLALYIAWMNKWLLGTRQRMAALAVYIMCLAIVICGVLLDSQITLYGIASLSAFMLFYLNWTLPLAPILAGVGGAIVHSLDPEHLEQQRQQNRFAKQDRTLVDAQYTAQIAGQRAELEVAKSIKNTQLTSRAYVAHAIAETVRSPEVLAQLQSQAKNDLPALLHAAGINVSAFAMPEPAIAQAPQSNPFADLLREPTAKEYALYLHNQRHPEKATDSDEIVIIDGVAREAVPVDAKPDMGFKPPTSETEFYEMLDRNPEMVSWVASLASKASAEAPTGAASQPVASTSAQTQTTRTAQPQPAKVSRANDLTNAFDEAEDFLAQHEGA